VRIRRSDEREFAHLSILLGEFGLQLLELRPQLLGCIVNRPPAVALSCDATECCWDMACNDDRRVWLLNGLGICAARDQVA
jgi:hypothetical protein